MRNDADEIANLLKGDEALFAEHLKIQLFAKFRRGLRRQLVAGLLVRGERAFGKVLGRHACGDEE